MQQQPTPDSLPLPQTTRLGQPTPPPFEHAAFHQHTTQQDRQNAPMMHGYQPNIAEPPNNTNISTDNMMPNMQKQPSVSEKINVSQPKLDAIYTCEIPATGQDMTVRSDRPCMAAWASSGLISYTLTGRYVCIFHPDQPAFIYYFSLPNLLATDVGKVMQHEQFIGPQKPPPSEDTDDFVTAISFRRLGQVDTLLVGTAKGYVCMMKPYQTLVSAWELLDRKRMDTHEILQVVYVERDHKYTLQDEPEDSWTPDNEDVYPLSFVHGERSGYLALSNSGYLYLRTFQFNEMEVEQTLTHRVRIFTPQPYPDLPLTTIAFTNSGEVAVCYSHKATAAQVRTFFVAFNCRAKMTGDMVKMPLYAQIFHIEMTVEELPPVPVLQAEVKFCEYVSPYRFDSICVVTLSNCIHYYTLHESETQQGQFEWYKHDELNYGNDNVEAILMPQSVSATLHEFLKSRRYSGSSFIVVTREKIDVVQLVTMRIFQSENRNFLGEISVPTGSSTTLKMTSKVHPDQVKKIDFHCGCLSPLGASWFLLTSHRGRQYTNLKCVKYSNPGFIVQCKEEATELQYLMKFSSLNEMGIWEMMCILSYLPINFALVIIGRVGTWALRKHGQFTHETTSNLLHRMIMHHTLYGRISNNEQLMIESKSQLLMLILCNATNLFSTIVGYDIYTNFHQKDIELDSEIRAIRLKNEKINPKKPDGQDKPSTGEKSSNMQGGTGSTMHTPTGNASPTEADKAIQELVNNFENIENYTIEINPDTVDKALIASLQSVLQYVCDAVIFLLKQSRKSGFKTVNILSKIECNNDIPNSLAEQHSSGVNFIKNFNAMLGANAENLTPEMEENYLLRHMRYSKHSQLFQTSRTLLASMYSMLKLVPQAQPIIFCRSSGDNVLDNLKFFFKLTSTFYLDLVQVHQVSEGTWQEYRACVDAIYYEKPNKLTLIQPGGVCYDLRHIFGTGALSFNPDEHGNYYPIRYRVQKPGVVCRTYPDGSTYFSEEDPGDKQNTMTKRPAMDYGPEGRLRPAYTSESPNEIVEGSSQLKIDILTGAIFPGCMGSKCALWESMFEGGLVGILWRHSITRPFTATNSRPMLAP